jgi:hypothetical protein
VAASNQTDRPGVGGQTKHPQGVSYPTPEVMPQGVVLSQSPRGAAMLIQFTNPQQPLYGTGLTSRGATLPPPAESNIPGQGPIDRGY